MQTNNQQPTILTKENFWNELSAKHPEQMAEFSNWCNEYKKRVNFDELFKNGYSGNPNYNWKIKIHDLPIAMQIGIFLQFCLETPHRYEFIEGMPGTMAAFAEAIKAWFAAEHAFAMSPSPSSLRGTKKTGEGRGDANEAESLLTQQLEGRIWRQGMKPGIREINTADDLRNLDYLYNHPDNFAEN